MAHKGHTLSRTVLLIPNSGLFVTLVVKGTVLSSEAQQEWQPQCPVSHEIGGGNNQPGAQAGDLSWDVQQVSGKKCIFNLQDLQLRMSLSGNHLTTRQGPSVSENELI